MDVWHLLGDFVHEGLLAPGTIGELIGRVLSILAVDSAISALTDPYEHRYHNAHYGRILLSGAPYRRCMGGPMSHCPYQQCGAQQEVRCQNY
jgi:hypothetical protein